MLVMVLLSLALVPLLFKWLKKHKFQSLTPLLGKGACPEDHPIHLGMLGMHGTAYANKGIVDCDFLSIGARWDDRITGELSEFCKDAEKFTSTSTALNSIKSLNPDVSLAGDAKLVIEDLLPLIEQGDTADWLAEMPKPGAKTSHLSIPRRAACVRNMFSTAWINLVAVKSSHDYRRWSASNVGSSVLPHHPRIAIGSVPAAQAPWATASLLPLAPHLLPANKQSLLLVTVVSK